MNLGLGRSEDCEGGSAKYPRECRPSLWTHVSPALGSSLLFLVIRKAEETYRQEKGSSPNRDKSR